MTILFSGYLVISPNRERLFLQFSLECPYLTMKARLDRVKKDAMNSRPSRDANKFAITAFVLTTKYQRVPQAKQCDCKALNQLSCYHIFLNKE